jgi:hypothetical protein
MAFASGQDDLGAIRGVALGAAFDDGASPFFTPMREADALARLHRLHHVFQRQFMGLLDLRG